jgi:PAS domain S-box-containing protein
MMETDDLSWLDDNVRARALETLKALFANSPLCMMTFDAKGTVIGVNPYTSSFAGQCQSVYQGINMLEHPVLRRLGWTDLLQRVLAGESIEVSDTRWVTLFSGEERYVDVTVAPILVDKRVVGGVAFLTDATAKHRAEGVKLVKARQARELELFLARDIGQPMKVLSEWSALDAPPLERTALAMVTVRELASLFEDLQQFLQLEAYRPMLSRVVFAEAMRAAGMTPLEAANSMTVTADPRLLHHVLKNLVRCGARIGGGSLSLSSRDGRVIIEIAIEGTRELLEQLLSASSLSMMESSGASSSLVAARWMVEMMGGTLQLGESGRVRIELASAD